MRFCPRSVTERMRHFLQQDRWTLDFAAAVVFAMGMAAEFQIIGDSGEKRWGRILSAAGFALVMYTGAFLLGILLRKRIRSIPSWVWMSVVGGLIQALGILIRAIPNWLDHYRRFSESSGKPLSGEICKLLAYGLFYWIILAVSGAIFLVMARYAIAFLNTICRVIFKKQSQR